MLRIGKLTDYAAILMAHAARTPERRISAQQIGQELELPVPTVAKLLKQLTQAGLMGSTRGAGGGYQLMRAPASISMAEVIEAIEGPLAMTECVLADERCERSADCATRANWRLISQAVRVALQAVSLADMAAASSRSSRVRSLKQV